jgi:hypothetical protein
VVDKLSIERFRRAQHFGTDRIRQSLKALLGATAVNGKI